MNRALVSIAKRAATKVNNSTSPSPNSKLFVAGLSWSVDEKSLKDAFSSFGEVTEVRIAYDKVSGRSRGFGFVNFTKEDEAISAKDAMDGKVNLGIVRSTAASKLCS
ncbi:glycine-rich RNA-binding protein 4, mitochondrial isoform X3 [Jatropha curcas]|uniref:glycine-rich RNA-binding protein 4, mitochondrial isoform X3 n=1 Tax=Jatropha curcas TaxID=180498 RepID=UPI0005FAAC9C|nr:glycine-rich RNA-binding protein 4, mitochondrial isoform X3 [Jatropha curcas]